MAKELGQIHVVNYSQAITNTGAAQNAINVDLPGQLSEQLQTIIRAGTYHKCVGIDMTLDTVGTVGGGQITGYIRYYAPTKGRCEAFRGAFKSMKEQMKIQGIETRTNPLYDFRAPINGFAHLNGVFPNRATLDGSQGLALRNDGNPGASIFEVHNRNVQPTFTGTPGELYQAGFDTMIGGPSSSNVDFVLNDAVPFTGDRNTASIEYEEIPFMLTWTPDTTDLAVVWNWRPDPALFLAILCGQMSVVVEEVNLDGGAGAVNLNVAVMVSGWKSIMGDPNRKSKSRTSKRMK
jgi:hypothetical protein